MWHSVVGQISHDFLRDCSTFRLLWTTDTENLDLLCVLCLWGKAW